jgi:hypothetical protein
MTNSIVSLGRNESVVSNYQLAYSLILFFLKSQFSVTNKRLIAVVPNLFLIVPVGQQDVSYPLNNIATVACSTNLNVKKLLGGTILALVGVSMKSFLGIIILLFGIIIAVSGFETVILIRNNSGARIVYSIAPWESDRAREIVDDLNQVIAENL